MSTKDYSIDYSKWDKIAESDDDDDSDDAPVRPRVTRLDAPGRVTFGGNHPDTIVLSASSGPSPTTSATASSSSQKNGAGSSFETCAPSSRPLDPSATTTTAFAESPSDLSSEPKSTVPASWTDKGAAVLADDASSTEKTEPRFSYYWSQDRLSVHVRVPLPQLPRDTKATYNVSVSGILPYTERNQAVMSASQTQRILVEQSMHCTLTNEDVTTILLDGELPHPAHLPEEDDTMDWSIEQYEMVPVGGKSSPPPPTILRYILVSLFKATPVPGMALWWKKLLREHSTEIPLTWVERNTAFQQAWDEAHEQFRKTVSQPPKYSV
jgi:hypothetical protein